MSSTPIAFPTVLIQYGDKRSASTIQSQILCATMALLHPLGKPPVRCQFADHIKWPEAGQNHSNPLAEWRKRWGSRPLVIKTHTRDMLLPQKLFYWLFCSTSRNVSSDGRALTTKQIQQEIGRPVKYVQLVDDLQRLSVRVMNDYQLIFRLNRSQTTELLEYIQPWSVLRRCCGAQMSRSFHDKLVRSKIPGPHGRNGERHMCEDQDLRVVEAALVRSKLFRRFYREVPYLRKVSNIDGDLSGEYCTCTNNFIARTGEPMWSHSLAQAAMNCTDHTSALTNVHAGD